MRSAGRNLLREAVLWVFVIGAGIGAALFHEEIVEELGASAPDVRPAAARNALPAGSDGGDRVVRLQADSRGHFAVSAYINDRPVDLVADTGATLVTLTFEDARRLGLSPMDADFTHRTQTANGIARVATVRLDRVRVGDIMLRDVRAIVAEPGRLSVNLLGMSFIGALTRVEMQGRELVLEQ